MTDYLKSRPTDQSPKGYPTQKQNLNEWVKAGQSDISECYNLAEVQNKYGISEKALHDIIKRNNIPKIKKGWYSYVPKTFIDELFK